MCTFDMRYLEAILKTHDYLKMHPLGLKIQPFKIFPANKTSKDMLFIEKMVVVETSALPDTRKYMVQQLISIFNGKNKTHRRSGGLNFTFVEWFAAKGYRSSGSNQTISSTMASKNTIIFKKLLGRS